MNVTVLSFDLACELLHFTDERDIDSYEQATVIFENGGSKSELYRSLFSLGILADLIRWHAENPGCRMGTIYFATEEGR